MSDCNRVHVFGYYFVFWLGTIVGVMDDGRKDTYGVFADPVDLEEVCRFFFLWVGKSCFWKTPLSWKFKFCFWLAASWLSWCDRASHGLCHCEEEVGKWILYYLRTIWGMQTWYTYDAQTWELRLKMWVVSKTQPNVVSTEHVKKTIVNG